MSAATVASAVVMRMHAEAGDSLLCAGSVMGARTSERPAECADRDDAVEAPLLRIALAEIKRAREHLVRWVAAVTGAEIARKEPLDCAHVGNSVGSPIQSVSFVREQQILRIMIARAQRSDEAIGLIAPHTDVIGALHDQ